MVKKVDNISTTDTNDLVKKLVITQKINEIENKINDHDHTKYITTQEFNKLTLEMFGSILAQANLVRKNYIANFVKKAAFDDK